MAPGGSPSTVTVKINDCTIIGKAQSASDAYPRPLDIFYGLRYAEAERFSAPVCTPLGSCSGEIDATKPKPPCPVPMSLQDSSEDSLRVNITRPGGTGGDGGLPVMVFFHGGGFNFGSPLDDDVEAFVARGERDIVSVSVAYRLGALGFGPGEEGDDADSNLGLRDQRAAVDWVKEWIGAFGGNGEDVTLMGVSAGAHSVGHHMLHPSPLPFRKAILESGSATARSVLSISHPRTKAQFASFRRHLPGDKQNRTTEAVVHASLMVWAEYMDSLAWPFQPVVDDAADMIPDLPLRLWRQPRLVPPAVLTGFCSHEGADFRPRRLPPFRDFFAALIPNLDLDALEEVYPDPDRDASSRYAAGGGGGGQARRWYEAYGHYAYICPVLHTAHMASRAGARVYLYEYAGLNGGEGEGKTAGHCAQTPLVRGTLEGMGDKPGLRATSREMHRRWAAFVASPGGSLGGEEWPAFETPFGGAGGKGELLIFGEGNDEALGGTERGVPVRTRRVTEREMEVCRFWWDRMELSQGMGKKGVVREPW